ncbi:EamA family transporter [Fodinicola acaciae]|uniref:EamA family transporter n=1 Tax=Fodinicola acaciae TaxID=2681555 RepID=UPI0013CF717F|nr:EamA family transporter [Fodinicola acaciae]
MVAVILAVLAAIAYGSSDFVAGVASRRMHYALVGVFGQVSAALITVIVSLIVGGSPTIGAILWGGLGGLGGALGSLALYRGLARARISVVAPLSGVVAAVLPALVGLAIGDRPGPVAGIGLVLALPAVWLVSAAKDEQPDRPSGVLDGLMAGVGFGLLFIALQQAGSGSGLWPTAAEQVLSVPPALLFYLVARRRIVAATGAPPPGDVLTVRTLAGPAAVGVLGAVAVMTYFLATHVGMLTVVAVLTSLYPAATIALARFVLSERISRQQGAGLLLAGLAVALITAG